MASNKVRYWAKYIFLDVSWISEHFHKPKKLVTEKKKFHHIPSYAENLK